MSTAWGWVDKFRDGSFKVGEYRTHRERKLSGEECTGKVVPENVAEVMALIDLLSPSTKLPGGSHKDLFSQRSTYFINLTDLQTEGE